MFQAEERLTSFSASTFSRYCDWVWFSPRITGLDPTVFIGGKVRPKGGVGHRETQLSTGSLVFHLGFTSLHDDDDDPDDIYIMMSVCLFVCNEKSSLPPGSLL